MKVQSKKVPENIQEMTVEQWEKTPTHIKRLFRIIEPDLIVLKKPVNYPILKVEKVNPLVKKTIKK